MQDKELDLNKVLRVCWAGKWTISAFIFFFLIVALAYNTYKKNTSPKPFYVTVSPYSVILYQPFAEKICLRNLACIRQITSENFNASVYKSSPSNESITKNWETSGYDASFNIPSCPPGRFCILHQSWFQYDMTKYAELLQNHNQAFTNDILRNVEIQLSKYIKIDKNIFENSEVLTQDYLALQNIAAAIQNGHMAINFDEPYSVEIKLSHNPYVIIIISLILATFTGSIILLLKDALFTSKNLSA